MTTQIKMLRTTLVAPTGVFTEIWQEGSVYTVSDDLLRLLIEIGACEIMTKAIDAAPENKAEPRKRGRPRKVEE